MPKIAEAARLDRRRYVIESAWKMLLARGFSRHVDGRCDRRDQDAGRCKRPHPSDARARIIELTDQGRDALRETLVTLLSAEAGDS